MSASSCGHRVLYALQNGTGAVLSKIAIISIPFLLSTIGYLLNATLDARDRVTRQTVQTLAEKIDDLSVRVDSIGAIVRDVGDRAMATQGDIKALQASQRGLEMQVNERERR